MKSVIPFTKDLEFSTKVSEITSISLEREFEIKEASIDGNLFVTGDYKSHEVSANVIPFSYKIPFTIEVPDNLEKDSITLEIVDFAYDMLEESKITVNIELELSGNVKEEKVEVEEEIEIPEVKTEELIQMLEERSSEEKELKEIEEQEEKEEEQNEEIENKEEETREGEEELILENVTEDEEYATYHIHIVKNGETVETICTMYNSNLSMLAEYNDLSNVTPGEKLIIPENEE